jgi:hypothetical protein
MTKTPGERYSRDQEVDRQFQLVTAGKSRFLTALSAHLYRSSGARLFPRSRDQGLLHAVSSFRVSHGLAEFQ